MTRKKNMKELTYEEYVELFIHHVPKAEKVDTLTYRGRCRMCGDSKRDTNKKRFYLLKERGSHPHAVKCHNCGYATSAQHFFLEIAPEEMKKHSKKWSERDLKEIESLSNGEPIFKHNKVTVKESQDDYLIRYDEELEKAKIALGNFFENYTYPIQDNAEAYDYMMGRNVPDYYVHEMRMLKSQFHDFKTFRFAYFRDYIMIPFLDIEDNKPYYFHSRRYKNMEGNMPSYLACPYRPVDADVNFFLNELRVHNDDPIIVAEGTIDSMNLPNSIAINGIHKLTPEQIKRFEHRYGEDIIYALDNDVIDKDAGIKAKELLKMGKRVFLWKELMKDVPAVSTIKDFNKLCCMGGQYQVPLETILKYTKNNVSALL